MRKHFFVKPRLQLKHLFWNLGLIACSCLMGYFLIESVLHSTLPLRNLHPEEWAAVQTQLREGFAIIFLLLGIGTGLENYLLFHSVVGPLYALEKGLKNLAKGELNEEVRIRDSDQLQELILAFEEMRKIIRDRLLVQEKTSQLLSAELERVLSHVTTENISEIRQKLKQIREQAERKAA